MLNRLLPILAIAVLFAAAGGLLALTGCGGGTSPDAARNERDPKEVVKPDPNATAAAAPKAAAKAGGAGEPYDAAKAVSVVKGVVSFEGKAPKMTQIPVTEQVCAAHHGANGLKKEDLVVSDDNKVANVVVYVSDGSQGYNFDNYSLPPARVNQLGCQYLPHVLGLKTEQVLEIESSDPVTHNVHGLPKENTEFNISQPAKGVHPTKPHFSTPEMGVKVKCDVHGWMNAWLCIFDHPFFAVTGPDGAYEIKLPPGTYTISTWQELLPSRKVVASAPVKVTVAADKPGEANFTYKMKP